MKNYQKIIILAFLIISVVLVAGCVIINTQAPAGTTVPTPIVTIVPTAAPVETTITTAQPVVTIAPTVVPSPMTIRIPVVPATSLSNEPSVAVKAQYSTTAAARDFAVKLASHEKMTGVPTQKTRPLIKTFISTSRHDSVLEFTNRDTVPHIYYVEVNFYEENVQLYSTNGFAFYVESGESTLAEIIPPERATSYVIKNVDMVTTSGYYSTDYDLVQK